MNITVFMIESHNGNVDIVRYFDDKGIPQATDFSKFNFKSGSVNFSMLSKIIENQLSLERGD